MNVASNIENTKYKSDKDTKKYRQKKVEINGPVFRHHVQAFALEPT